MAVSVGTIFLDVQLNTSNVQNQLGSMGSMASKINFIKANSTSKTLNSNIKNITNNLKISNTNISSFTKNIHNSIGATSSLNNRFSLLNSTIGLLSRNFLYFFSIYRLFNFASESIDLGSGLVEDEHLLDITLGNMSENMKDYIKTLKASTGMAQAEATRLASGFTKAFKAMGMGNEQNNAFTQELMQKMGDVASAYNMSYEKVYNKFMSAIVGGNARTGRDMGISVMVADMQAYMESIGDNRTYNTLSSYEKMLLRYSKAMKDLDFTTGDFVKTQNTWSNQTRILSSTWDNFKTIVGQNLIMILTPVLQMVNKLMSAFESLAIKVNEFFKSLGWGSRLGNAGIGESVDEYTDAIEDANDSIANSASGAAKKISRALMGFDKVNKLTSSSSSGSGASGGSGLDFSTNNVTDSIEGTTNILDGITNKVKELKQLFENGFKFSFKADINQLYENIKSIKKSLGSIFNDEDVKSAASSFSRGFIEYLGSVAGTYASVGTSIATWITGGIATSLEENGESIKQWFIDISNNASSIASDLQEFNRAISKIFTTLEQDESTRTLANMITIVGSSFGTLTGLLSRFASDMVGLVTNPIVDNVGKIKDSILNTFKVANIEIGFFKDVLVEYGEKFTILYDEHIKPLMDKLKESFSDCLAIALEVYNEYFLPFMEGLGISFTNKIESDILPSLDDLIENVGKMCDFLVDIWDEGIHPLLEVITIVFSMAASNIIGSVKAIASIFGCLSNPISFACKLFEKFKGVGESVGEKLKSVGSTISDVFSGISNTVKDAINGVINCINGMINSINKFSIDIPSLTGEDKHIGFNIPNIPQLANGGYVKAGQGGVLAQIGEGRYGEVVTNDKQRKFDNDYVVNQIDKLIDSKLSNMNSGGTLQPVVFQIGDVEVASVLIDIIKGEIKRTGMSLV